MAMRFFSNRALSAEGLAGPPFSRRTFVQGVALVAVAGAADRASARGPTSASALLEGDQIDLSIGALPVNVTGRRRIATVVNGSMPAPTLKLSQGSLVTINVTNHLREPSSLHWHGLRLPADMDGVPGLSFRGIMPGETFTYRFPITQSGTYWYHSHSGMQEQTGAYGALILEPQSKEPYPFDRDHVVLLSDWTDQDPMTIQSNLKQQSDYYDRHQRTLGTLAGDVDREGLSAAWSNAAMWGRMRMNPTDIMDVTGSTYTFLVNGQPPAGNWTALFNPGERVRLRLINGSAMSTFDVRIPGLMMTVVAADGSDVHPVVVEELRIGVAETYDVIVQPSAARAYIIFAQAEDRSGFARATLAPHPDMTAPIPPMDPRPLRTMSDMGMAGMAEMAMGAMTSPAKTMSSMGDMSDMGTMASAGAASAPVSVNADGVDPRTLEGRPGVDNVAMTTTDRLGDAGDGLDGNGRRVLLYTDLRALNPDPDRKAPRRDIEFHLTGNMQRWIWGFDGKTFSEACPIRIARSERVRFILINDTMMEHPMHLHGFLVSLENGQDALPLKHTINVKPAERTSFVFTADTPGRWAFHCHLMYHMEAGMFRTVIVA
jgi:CopA family copper-resistance protein